MAEICRDLPTSTFLPLPKYHRTLGNPIWHISILLDTLLVLMLILNKFRVVLLYFAAMYRIVCWFPPHGQGEWQDSRLGQAIFVSFAEVTMTK